MENKDKYTDEILSSWDQLATRKAKATIDLTSKIMDSVGQTNYQATQFSPLRWAATVLLLVSANIYIWFTQNENAEEYASEFNIEEIYNQEITSFIDLNDFYDETE